MTTTKTTTKTAHQLRKGDRIAMHGGVFLITSDARVSRSHQPEIGFGPSSVLVFEGVCESGEEFSYFRPGSSWVVQGNHLRTFTCV